MPAASATEIASFVLSHAALVHRFDPLDPNLVPAGLEPAVEAEVLARIARHATETEWADPNVPGPARTMWRLAPEARRRELRRLREGNRLQAALDEVVADATDTFALHLHKALRDELDPAAVPAAERESAAAAAKFAADVLDERRSETAEAAMRGLRATLSDEAEEQRASGALCGKLIDRHEERAALEAFASTGAIPGSDRLPPSDTPAIASAVYLLTGPSGTGKSALVADLVRRWRGYAMRVPAPASWTNGRDVAGWAMSMAQSRADRAMSSSRRLMARLMARLLGRAAPGRIVVLDLDRLALAVGGEMEWTAEVTRQVGLGAPALAKHLSTLRGQRRRDRTRLDPSGKSVTALCATRADLKQGLVEALEAQQAVGAPLVVVLDDFEEPVMRSFPLDDEHVEQSLFGRILLWADSLATLTTTSGEPAFGTVRVIAVGNRMPPLDPTHLARWFRGRHDMRPLGTEEIPGLSQAPGEQPRDEGPARDEARAIERHQRVGPLRMSAAQLDRLPDEDRADAVLNCMAFARQQGHTGPRLAELAARLEREAEADAKRDNDAAAAIDSSRNRVFAFLRDPAIGTRIDYAFTFGDFAAAAGIGWGKVAEVEAAKLSDLSEPWRHPGDPVTHWIWQAALAVLALDDASDIRATLEDFLRMFAARVDPAHAGAEATGLMLAAAATIALGGCLSPQAIEATEALATAADRLDNVRSFAQLRLASLRPLWALRPSLPPKKLLIPTRRLRLFSESMVSVSQPSRSRGGLAPLIDFVAAARRNAPSAQDIDAFATTDADAITLDLTPPDADGRGTCADLLVGLSPEIYDTVVITLIEADRAASGAIDHAIAETRASAPFWPRDVVPGEIPARDRDRRGGLIARSVIHADRCGLLCFLVERVSGQADIPRLPSVTRLVQRYEALRRRAYAGDESPQAAAGPS